MIKNQLILFLFFLATSFVVSQTQIYQELQGDFHISRFGSSVAISSDGNVVVIGAPGDDNPNTSGAYFSVYELNNGSWSQVGNNITGGFLGDAFGFSVAISSDGSIIAVGSPGGEQGDNQNDSGLVKIYLNENGMLTQLGSDLVGFDQPNHRFGASISLSDDGTIIAIGAPETDYGGTVSIYEFSNNSWNLIGQNINQEINPNGFSKFGTSVSLSSNGNVVAIGAEIGDLNNVGYVTIFQNINDNWVQVGDVINADNSDDYFGASISISDDGSIFAVGAPFNDNAANSAGQVKVYKNLSGNWTQIGNDILGDFQSLCGSSVALSSDGSILVVGLKNSQNDDFFNTGEVRVFKNINNDWVQVGEKIEGYPPFSKFGNAVSITSNGTIIAIGAPKYFNDVPEEIGNTSFYSIASELALLEVIDDISGNANGENITAEQLNSIEGVSGAIDGVNYTTALQNGTFVDSNNPTAIEIQLIIDQVNNALSINDNLLLDFILYPNPTKNQFTIRLNDSSILKEVNIYNNLGQQILTSDKMIIDTSSLASGSYVVEVATNNGKATKQLIIE